MSLDADVIVVGSGPSGAQAAWRPAHSGLKVLILDVGNEETHYAGLIPPRPFLDLRREDPSQHRYFLGDRFEGVPVGPVKVGAQLTPPRQFIARDTDRLTPLLSGTFHPTESLALGGLGSGWGASAVRFSQADLEGLPLACADLAPHYEAVASRIGISGERDDLLEFYGDCESLQPPLEMDANASLLLKRYGARRDRFRAAGFHLGHPRLAVLTRDLDGRPAQQYREMEFYADDGSVYRPRFTVERLARLPGVTYARPYLVERFVEDGQSGEVEVTARHAREGGETRFRARRLILAAGAMGSARIALRSSGLFDRPTPLVCNAHVYVPCLHLPMLGRPMPERRHGLTQAGIIYVPSGDLRRLVYVEVHGYRSLLLFKLAKEAFLPARESIRILRHLLSALVILVIEHADEPSSSKWCALRRAEAGRPETLEVGYQAGAEQALAERQAERELLRQARRLGLIPIQRLDPGPGSSIHYGGTLPMSEAGGELTTCADGRLRGTRSVFVADGSVLPRLPAKPLTFTLMALADRVGAIVASELS